MPCRRRLQAQATGTTVIATPRPSPPSPAAHLASIAIRHRRHLGAAVGDVHPRCAPGLIATRFAEHRAGVGVLSAPLGLLPHQPQTRPPALNRLQSCSASPSTTPLHFLARFKRPIARREAGLRGGGRSASALSAVPCGPITLATAALWPWASWYSPAANCATRCNSAALAALDPVLCLGRRHDADDPGAGVRACRIVTPVGHAAAGPGPPARSTPFSAAVGPEPCGRRGWFALDVRGWSRLPSGRAHHPGGRSGARPSSW